jgi:hypothetical protein
MLRVTLTWRHNQLGHLTVQVFDEVFGMVKQYILDFDFLEAQALFTTILCSRFVPWTAVNVVYAVGVGRVNVEDSWHVM